MEEEKSVPFGAFLLKNSMYKTICDGFSKRFNVLFVTALALRHQMDLHKMQQQTEHSEELDSAQQKLSAFIKSILPYVDQAHQNEVNTAFDAFKQQHGNDRPILTLSEFQQLLDDFLEVFERQTNPPPPQEQQAPFSFPWFLQERFFGLVSAIEEDKHLTNEDKNHLSFIKLILDRDGALQQNSSLGGLQLQSLDLTNTGLFGPDGIQNPVVSQYMDALRGAYAVYIGMCSNLEFKKECIIELNLTSQERDG